MSDKPQYQCPYPGCRKTSETAAACQHGKAHVTMKLTRTVTGSRMDTMAGRKRLSNPNRE